MARATRTATSNRWRVPSLLLGVVVVGLLSAQPALTAGQARQAAR